MTEPVEVDTKPVPEPSNDQPVTEESHVMLLLTDKLAMSVHAQLIANSALGDHGPLAANHAMEVYHQELELS